jgi:hypothetical protein
MALVENDTPAQAQSAESTLTPDEQMRSMGIPTHSTPGVAMPYGGQEDSTKVLQSEQAPDDVKLAAFQKQKQFEDQQAVGQAQVESYKAANDFSNLQKYNQKLAEVDQFNSEAKSRGLKPLGVPDPAQFNLTADKIAKLSQPGVAAAVAPVAQQQQEDQHNVELAKAQEDALKQQNALQMGTLKAQQDIEDQKKKKMDEAIALVDSKDKDFDKIDPNRFWADKSTFQKILGAIAMSSTGQQGSDVGYNIIKNAMDKDLESQKINMEQKQHMKANALKRVELEINKFGELSKDQERKFQMAQIAQKFNQDRTALQQDLVAKQYIISAATDPNKGISSQEAESLLDKDQKMRQVVLPNGRIVLARTELDKKNLEEQLGESSKAVEYAKKLKELGNQLTLGDKLTPSQFSSIKGQIEQTRTALIGSLRLPFTGPGILNEQEFKRLSSAIGDPTVMFQSKDRFNSQVDGLVNLLGTAQRASFRRAGLNIKPSKADQYREMAAKQGMDPEKIELAIRKSGLE